MGQKNVQALSRSNSEPIDAAARIQRFQTPAGNSMRSDMIRVITSGSKTVNFHGRAFCEQPEVVSRVPGWSAEKLARHLKSPFYSMTRSDSGEAPSGIQPASLVAD